MGPVHSKAFYDGRTNVTWDKCHVAPMVTFMYIRHKHFILAIGGTNVNLIWKLAKMS